MFRPHHTGFRYGGNGVQDVRMVWCVISIHVGVVTDWSGQNRVELSIYQSIYVPTFTYGHELWVVADRMRMRRLRWFRHLIRMLPECLSLEVFWARPTGNWPRGGPRTHRSNYIPHLPRGTPEGPPGGAGKRSIGDGRPENKAYPAATDLILDKRKKMDGWMEGICWCFDIKTIGDALQWDIPKIWIRKDTALNQEFHKN